MEPYTEPLGLSSREFGRYPRREPCLPLLRGLGDPAQLLGVDLGPALECEQPVALLLDVGELRIAEALDRSWLHERLDHLLVCVQQPLAAVCLRVPEPTVVREGDSAELADDHGLAAVAVAGHIRRVLAGA